MAVFKYSVIARSILFLIFYLFFIFNNLSVITLFPVLAILIFVFLVIKASYRENIEEFNKLVHGAFSQPWDVRLHNVTLEYMQSKLENAGLKVTKKRLDGYRIVIEGERE